MTLEDPKTGREVHVYRDPMNYVDWGTRVRSGNAWYVNKHQVIKWWQDLERLQVVK